MEEILLSLSSGLLMCLVLLMVAVVFIMRRNGDLGGGPGSRSGDIPGSGGAGGPGDPLSIPVLVKDKAPWYIRGMSHENNFKVEDGKLRLNYVGGKWASESGASFHANPFKSLPKDSCVFGYKVYFPPDFNFKKGGKLPGLCIGNNDKDCATGSNWSTSGGSYRVMFRENGVAIAYLYLPLGDPESALKAQSKSYKAVADTGHAGHNLWRKEASLKFQKGKWNTVSMRLRLNTPGSSNGSLSLTINGTTKSLDGIVWRKSAASKISSVNVVSFFGGSTSDWAAPSGAWAAFSDFRFKAE